jgi:hypothetical protein
MTSAARLRRLERLESRQPRGDYSRDPGPAAIALLQWCIASAEAVKAGKACPLPSEPPMPESEWSDAKRRVMAEADRMARRLRAGPEAA